MNLISHNFVAKKVLSKYNSLIAAGCHLPDLVPFLKNSMLIFEEIHENPEAVYSYLTKEQETNLDLALGLMTHSVKFGADKFNKEIDTWLLNDNTELKTQIAEKIVYATGITTKMAIGPMMHNYLWCGLDFYILDNYPAFINELNKYYGEINISEISDILAKTFNKPYKTIENNVAVHISRVTNRKIQTKIDFISFWKDFVSELPENDNIDITKTVDTVNFIENLFYDRWESINARVVSDIKLRMRDYL